MTDAKLWSFQESVYTVVSASLAGDDVPIFTAPPAPPPPEFARLDGFDMRADDMKNASRGAHSFMVHYFQQPSTSMKRTKTQLSKIVAALKAARFDGRKLTLEFIEFPMASDQTAHGFARFTVSLI